MWVAKTLINQFTATLIVTLHIQWQQNHSSLQQWAADSSGQPAAVGSRQQWAADSSGQHTVAFWAKSVIWKHLRPDTSVAWLLFCFKLIAIYGVNNESIQQVIMQLVPVLFRLKCTQPEPNAYTQSTGMLNCVAHGTYHYRYLGMEGVCADV